MAKGEVKWKEGAEKEAEEREDVAGVGGEG